MPRIKFWAGSRLVRELDNRDGMLLSFNHHNDSHMAYNFPQRPMMYAVQVSDYEFFTKSPDESRVIFDRIQEGKSRGVDVNVYLDEEVNT